MIEAEGRQARPGHKVQRCNQTRAHSFQSQPKLALTCVLVYRACRLPVASSRRISVGSQYSYRSGSLSTNHKLAHKHIIKSSSFHCACGYSGILT